MALRLVPNKKEIEIPAAIDERLKRGRNRMEEGKGKRNECLSFWRGDHYKWVDSKGALQSQATTTDYLGRSGKAPHRVRQARSLFTDVIAHEIAAATQRVPSYDCLPSTIDPEDAGAARLAKKVLLYGHDKWGVREKIERVVTYAAVADEGFAWPYWDSAVGPYVGDGLGQGEVRIRVFGPNEVYWEPGVNFEESRWHAIEQARDIEDVKELEGYVGGELNPDAKSQEDQPEGSTLVLVTDYLERPSPKNPTGKWITCANGRVVVEARAYPCTDPKGEVVDEPVLHKLSYFSDPAQDRDLGLGRYLIDAQRVFNDLTNRQLEWVRLALNPQVIIQNGEFKQRLTDEPGAVYNAYGTGTVSWRPVPPIPGELSNMREEVRRDMAQIAAQNDIPGQVESGKAIAALLEKDSNRRATFIASLAEFYSRLGRHCLYLVQKHYTEDRLLKVRGPFGPELLENFRGAQLRGQADVRVQPASIEPRTRENVEQKVMNFAQLGWVSPTAAMQAINSGTADGLIKGYELDLERANEIIQKIKEGPEVLFAEPDRPAFPGEDPGLDEMGQRRTAIPGWMPRPFDSVPVQKSQLSDWMKTSEYSTLPPEQKEAANLYYSALLDLEMRAAQRDAALQAQQAEDQGMLNAAKPQGMKPNPSLPSLSGSEAA